MPHVAADRGRLRWQCRRGMRELDVLLSRFLETRYATASSTERALFAEILSWQDPELLRYLLGDERHECADVAALFAKIRGP